jgi:hypothetical protein
MGYRVVFRHFDAVRFSLSPTDPLLTMMKNLTERKRKR